MIETTTLHNMIRKFVSYGAPVQDDNEGPNKPDWPFFSKLAEQDVMHEYQMQEAAQRFHKYRNTQLPRILRELGLTDLGNDATQFLEQMKQQGDAAMEAKKKADAYLSLKNQVTRDVTQSIIKGKDYAVHLEKLTDTQQSEIDTLVDVARQAAADYEKAQRAARTVAARIVEDKWTNRWGKESITERIGLLYRYDPDLNNALKKALTFPDVKFDGRNKLWSIKNDGAVIAKAIKVIESLNYYAGDELIGFLDGASTDVSTPQTNEVSVSLEKGTTLVLRWPFLADPNERNSFLAVIKKTDGRKFRPDDKTWAVSIAQAGDLIDRLNKYITNEWNVSYTNAINVANEMISAMQSIEQVGTYMEQRAERIAISGAACLNDEDVIADIRNQFDGVFPEGLDLYPFQYVGVQFAELAGGRCLIGDDMGVGKTIQAIGYCAVHPEQLPALVVCPANVKFNWVKEINTWLPDAHTHVVKKGKESIPKDADFVVINYDLMKKQLFNLLDCNFNIIIFDESHYLKNSKAQRTQASLELAQESDAILCLSGTAVTNRPIEFFTTLNLLRPAEFPSHHTYGVRYCAGEQVHIGRGRYAWQYKGASNTDELHNRVRDFTIRRLKKEVMDELPDKIRSIHTVEPTKNELRSYKETHDSWMTQYQTHRARGSMPKGFVLNMLTDLRHQCGLLKVNSTIKWVDEYKEQNPDTPLVIFFHHKDVGKGLMEGLKEDYSVAGIVGGTPAETRQQRVEQFQDGQLDVLLCSTLAAKEGITLTAADTVVFVEREWVPGWEEQAEDRINRIGQEAETVWATYISVKGTIDEKFDRVIEEKRKVVKAVLDGGDIEERQGIAAALIESMIESGELPADFLTAFDKKSSKQKPKAVIE